MDLTSFAPIESSILIENSPTVCDEIQQECRANMDPEIPHVDTQAQKIIALQEENQELKLRVQQLEEFTLALLDGYLRETSSLVL